MKGAKYPPIFDGHNDTLLDFYFPERGGGRSFFVRAERGHIDLPRALEGGFGGGFFAIFVRERPRPSGDSDSAGKGHVSKDPGPEMATIDLAYAQRYTEGVMATLFGLEEESQGQFKVVRDSSELADCLRKGVVAAVTHFEGAEAIDPDLANLDDYYDAGLRSLGITWSRSNLFGHGVPFRFPHSPDTGPGLTVAGQELVRQCNRLGIMVDLSHLNEKGFWDVARLSDAPLVATHSGAHALCPTTRNLTDQQLDAIGESDGIVGINFHVWVSLCRWQARPKHAAG